MIPEFDSIKAGKTKLATNIINRYTSLASAVNLLSERKLTLLDPNTWDDKNDVHYLDRYKKAVSAKSVYALCLSRAGQTYHHWRVFAGGPDGVCISFFEDKLKESFEWDPRVEYQDVEYLSIREARSRVPLEDDDLKFVKHSRYKPEQETRVVFTDKRAKTEFPSYDIDLDAVKRITLSPWLSKPLVSSMRKLLKSIDGCRDLEVYRSTLTDFKDWKALADRR
ncbi:hypothetical protein RUE5091_02285 [Ruegeria denitrificans]|uniref:DUF2971 domain-containing protein n=1 Tax=Ruegeria denitrificans TaxID=1715692 RepID=A0A0P1IAN7_9RHOB|nr:DUF2971 domain-containing protein [Ruegeria denitrificans]CUK01716.1 hypothetical protein RUE5091_02285 [Ruegeria denitrificans]